MRNIYERGEATANRTNGGCGQGDRLPPRGSASQMGGGGGGTFSPELYGAC